MPGHRAQQPLAPGLGLFAIAGIEQRIERQRRIAQPAMAVVPVAAAAQRLRQRGGGRGDDAARGLEGQELQRDQRTQHRIAPRIRRPFPVAALGPFLPPRDRAVHAFDPVGHEMRGAVRTVVRQGEGHHRARVHIEARRGLELVALELDGRMQLDGVRPGYGAQAVVAPPHPGHRLAVVEAQHQLHVHLHVPGFAAHDAHHVRAFVVVAERHEVEQRGRARGGLVARFQHGGIGHVAPRNARGLAVRGDAPASMALVAEQRREAGGRIEVRQAEPIDRAVPRDQRGGEHIPDESVVFQGFGHARRPMLRP
ncbi:hypothetical protein D9M68_551280 [compost metagenome]